MRKWDSVNIDYFKVVENIQPRLSMESPELTFTLAYVVFSLCFVFTPNEFRSAGLTVQNVFSSWLGSEDAGFIQYHVRRTSVTLLLHSALPLGTVTITLTDRVGSIYCHDMLPSSLSQAVTVTYSMKMNHEDRVGESCLPALTLLSL